MNTAPTSTVILAIVLILVAAAAIIAALARRKRQSLRLKKRFGKEYERTVERAGSQSKAEVELRQREVRVAKLDIRPLPAEEARRFSQAWRALQGRFVDNPKGAVVQADKLVRELMTARGYPMGDFERRASDISVDHPGVVDAYRSAQVIAAKDARGEADTEELRKAIVHYRTLFADLLEVSADPAGETPSSSVAAQS
jgi:hypothetical protein